MCVCVQQIRLAEVEQASLMSEQLSDKSSSLALPDDLSLDEHSSYQLLVRDSQVGLAPPSSFARLLPPSDTLRLSHHALPSQRGSSDSHSSEELLRHCSSGSEEGSRETFEEGVRPVEDTPNPACCAGIKVHVEQQIPHALEVDARARDAPCCELQNEIFQDANAFS